MVKIDTLGREICAENLRARCRYGRNLRTGEGVRYGTGTIASTKVNADENDRTLTLTTLAAGQATISLN